MVSSKAVFFLLFPDTKPSRNSTYIFEAVTRPTKTLTPTAFLQLTKKKKKKEEGKIMAVHNKATLMVMAVIAAAIASTSLTDAQNTPSCASKLVPCASFLNTTTKPNAECCNSIKEAVANELPCLCTLYNTPGLLSSFHVSLEDALRLTRDCNVPSDLSSCKNSGAPSPGSSVPPPGTPGNDGNGATAREAWAGITSLLLFWAASMMLY
ncbi:hypothetical protein CICLE_v10022260mg [Citrus x clementina]|uniref:Bifunctional inhibitor/plant lipid transfer protein/seed storage helical domain-containing protein n=2 Tax=Citrus clementina TaxID=85681 RepID=V4VLK6_CITCL|nr:hypothetical protein CICLE_v10022260mg [Citrus x clementina]